MVAFSKARKEAILNQLLSPEQLSIAELSKREGVSRSFLYRCRQELKAAGTLRTVPSQLDESCSAETKFGIVVETASMSEIQLAEYCRSKIMRFTSTTVNPAHGTPQP